MNELKSAESILKFESGDVLIVMGGPSYPKLSLFMELSGSPGQKRSRVKAMLYSLHHAY